ATVNRTVEFERASLTVKSGSTAVMKVSPTGASTSLTIGSGAAGVKVSASDIDGGFLITAAGVAGKLDIGTLTLTRPDGSPLPGLSSANLSNFKLEWSTNGIGVMRTFGSGSVAYTDNNRHNLP